MSQPIFDSRDKRYKTPYGAVAAGTRVEFCLRPERQLGFSWAVLRARFEMDGDRVTESSMPWTDTALGYDCFSGSLDTGDYVGLVWYSFRLEGLDGRHLELGEYQLTVYDGTESVPDWFGQGVTYQIFPDRFCRTHTPDPTGMVGGRTIHQDWSEDPEFRPNEKGEIVKLIPDGEAIPEFVPRALYGHNIKEYSNLASILPQIYAEEKDNW